MFTQRRHIKQLGKGNFASVYLQMNGKLCYACKKIRFPLGYSLKFLIDQINSLRCLDHPNLVKCLGSSFNSFKSFDIFLQYIPGQMLDVTYEFNRDQEKLFYWIYQLCKGLEYLKYKGIVHRDLKPQNILVDKNGIVKIVDFGISKIMDNQHSEIMGTIYYIAPQIIKDKFICYQSDIWSLGIMFYQLTHRKMPFRFPPKEEQTRENILKCISQIQISETCCSPQMVLLLKGMLQVNPYKRMTAQQILNHKVIRSRQKIFVQMYNEGIRQSSK